MSGYLIKDTTKEQQEQIVSDSLGNISASCDGCMPGLAEMYQEYIDGKKEIREISRMFQARYVSGEDGPGMKKEAVGSVKEKCVNHDSKAASFGVLFFVQKD